MTITFKEWDKLISKARKMVQKCKKCGNDMIYIDDYWRCNNCNARFYSNGEWYE